MRSLWMWKDLHMFSMLVLSIVSFMHLLLTLHSTPSIYLKDILGMSSVVYLSLARNMLLVLFELLLISDIVC